MSDKGRSYQVASDIADAVKKCPILSYRELHKLILSILEEHEPPFREVKDTHGID